MILFSSPSLIKGSFLYNLVRKIVYSRQSLWARQGWSQPIFPWLENHVSAPRKNKETEWAAVSGISPDTIRFTQSRSTPAHFNEQSLCSAMHCSHMWEHLDCLTASPLSWEPTWTSAVLRKLVGRKVSSWNGWTMVKQTQKRISKGKEWHSQAGKPSINRIALFPPVSLLFPAWSKHETKMVLTWDPVFEGWENKDGTNKWTDSESLLCLVHFPRKGRSNKKAPMYNKLGVLEEGAKGSWGHYQDPK